MHIRRLRESDADLMYKWMTDPQVIQWLNDDYSNCTIEDAKRIISNSFLGDEIHFAIATDKDEYVGTVSICHIDEIRKCAEFDIVVAQHAMRKGYAWFGMVEALNYAFMNYDIKVIYWKVVKDNDRAIRFFTKHGFISLDKKELERISWRQSNENDFVWFSVFRGDDYANMIQSKGVVSGCRIVNIKTIPTIGAGELSFFEANHDIGFDIKRIYYITNVSEGTRRGFHAHKSLKQLLFCPYGSIQIILDNGFIKEEITLSNPSIGIIIDKPTWREMLWLKSNSVLVVAASEYYDTEDYIKDYGVFLSWLPYHEKSRQKGGVK